MKPRIILDTNLLVLLIVGLYDPSFILKHKKLEDYSINDFDNLLILIGGSEIVVTANVLTEASNLLWLTGTPHKEQIRAFFRSFIEDSIEHSLVSKSTASSPYFMKLGLTDAGILDIPDGFGTILTVDLDLHVAALERGLDTDNFTHYRSF
jgi:hypothetical protein